MVCAVQDNLITLIPIKDPLTYKSYGRLKNYQTIGHAILLEHGPCSQNMLAHQTPNRKHNQGTYMLYP